MKKVIIGIFISLFAFIGIRAQVVDVVDVASLDTLATELVIPKCHTLSSTFEDRGFRNLRKITFNGIDNLLPHSFLGLPNLEEVVFEGDNFVIGGAQFVDNPKLKRVIFNGNTLMMNGSTMVVRCPDFEDFTINGLVTLSEIWDPYGAPKFKDYSGDFAMLYNGNSEAIKATSADKAAQNPKFVDAFNKQLTQLTTLTENFENNLGIVKNLKYFHNNIIEYADAFGVDTTAYVVAYNRAMEDEFFWSNLQRLQHSPSYATDSLAYRFTYAAPTDSLLQVSRSRFNLDSIAGQGDDISRVKNLMYWVHNNIPHDGSSSNPKMAWTLPNLYDVCKNEDRGVNCRMLAIALAEALLSEGIPARYLTCQSKDWDTDQDCHVICVAWSESLNKWIWVDPTFASYITDENGLLLHPGEVRERLISGAPLVLNEDANWNNQEPQTLDYYIKYYMAKNLYYITANLNNKARPEGSVENFNATYVTLAPSEHNYRGSQIISTNPTEFWQSPIE